MPIKKNKPTQSAKRENPKQPAGPRKRGVAQESKGSVSKSTKDLIKASFSSKSPSGSDYGFYKTDSGVVVKDGPVMKSSITGVGKFWRDHLPREVAVYGSGLDYKNPPYGKQTKNARIKWLEDRVSYLTMWHEDHNLRIKGLEKTLSHLLNALQK